MNVSVIIPAHNAADTIVETLSSLSAQTFDAWEAIVVDDGSSDATAERVTSFAGRDGRFRLLHQPQSGVSAARNAGVRAARFEWLLFLDADDWILPEYLERMAHVLTADHTLDAVYCGWVRVASNGVLVNESNWTETGDLFAAFGRTCAFAIHACVIRRSLVEAIGGFDSTLQVAEDWDLWQRIARMGARFGRVNASLALYRMRPGSSSVDGQRLLPDGLLVLKRGHSADPRVANPRPAYAHGLPADQLSNAALYLTCWSAGLMIGCGKDAQPLLDLVAGLWDPQLDPATAASILFEAVPLAIGRPPTAWHELWLDWEPNLHRFLQALESHSRSPGLCRRVCVVLERLVLAEADDRLPLTIGSTHGRCIEVTEPISDVLLDPAVERLYAAVKLEGEPIGVVDLPVCDGMVPARVLADAIAAQHYWPILGLFFNKTVYRHLMIERAPDGISLWRLTTRLAEKVVDGDRLSPAQLHDLIGWTVFLQELWGRPAWPHARFYDAAFAEPSGGPRRAAEGWLVVEVSEEPPDAEVAGEYLDVVMTAGGRPIGVCSLPAVEGIVSAHALRVAVTQAAGIELCRAAVREALLGSPLAAPETLRARLAAAARQRCPQSRRQADLALMDGAAERGTLAFSALVPGATDALSDALPTGEAGWVFARRPVGTIGTSVSRWAALPAAAVRELGQAARVAGEAVIRVGPDGAGPARAIYAPDLVWHSFRQGPPSTPASAHGARRVPDIAELEQMVPPPAESAAGSPARGAPKRAEAQEDQTRSDRLAILMYHRIAPSGGAATARYRVTPQAFEEQLRYLRDAGYYSVSLEQWQAAAETKQPLPGRPILLTFDDGDLDFLTCAWPLLQRYGFSTTVFLVAERVAGVNAWVNAFDETLQLLGWDEIRHLRDQGVVFGAHSASHLPLTSLTVADVVREGARARSIIERELGRSVTAFAYPYGDFDPVVQHLIGACGYVYGLTCRVGKSRFQDNLLALPRIEVAGTQQFQDFVASLA